MRNDKAIDMTQPCNELARSAIPQSVRQGDYVHNRCSLMAFSKGGIIIPYRRRFVYGIVQIIFTRYLQNGIDMQICISKKQIIWYNLAAIRTKIDIQTK